MGEVDTGGEGSREEGRRGVGNAGGQYTRGREVGREVGRRG